MLRDCEIVRHRWLGSVDWHCPKKEESIEFYEEIIFLCAARDFCFELRYRAIFPAKLPCNLYLNNCLIFSFSLFLSFLFCIGGGTSQDFQLRLLLRN